MNKQFKLSDLWRWLLGGLFILLITLHPLAKMLLLVSYSYNFQYYTRVLCENKDKPTMKCFGKCKLTKQMNALSCPSKQQKDEDRRGVNISSINDFIESVLCCQVLKPILFTTQVVKEPYYQTMLLSREGERIFHPPKFANLESTL